MEEAEDAPRYQASPQGERLEMRVRRLVPVPTGEYCDFCTSGTIFKLYSCSNFVFNDMRIFQRGSEGVWAACSKCAELVDGDRWAELTERACSTFAKLHGPISPSDAIRLREQFRTVHQLFRQHRISR